MLADKEAGYQHVEAGDLVVHGMDAFAGAIGVAEARGKCTPEYSVLRPRQRGAAQNHYYASLLRVMAQRDFIFVMCPSVRERAPRLRFATLRDMEVPVPPLPEQRTIASEIRAEAQRVAAVVRPMEASIDRLREYRRALITAAVTGQLDVTDERRVDAYDERVAEAGA
jgi:type I restriction enzyme S subunit